MGITADRSYSFLPAMPACPARAACQPSSAQLAALAVVLDRPELAADPRLLCSAARVCSSWRAAVAASGAGTTDVMLWFFPSDGEPDNPVAIQHDLWMLSSFADWLSKHGSLVRSITLHGLKETLIVAACQMLGMALKLAASGPRSLKLQSFISDVTSSEHASMPLLAALPNCLTELHITADECITQTFEHALGCTVLIHAVNRLKNLRKLCIREGVTERTFLHP